MISLNAKVNHARIRMKSYGFSQFNEDKIFDLPTFHGRPLIVVPKAGVSFYAIGPHRLHSETNGTLSESLRTRASSDPISPHAPAPNGEFTGCSCEI